MPQLVSHVFSGPIPCCSCQDVGPGSPAHPAWGSQWFWDEPPAQMPQACALVSEGTACPVVTCDSWLVLPHRIALLLLLPDTLQKTAGIFVFEPKELVLLSVCKQKGTTFSVNRFKHQKYYRYLKNLGDDCTTAIEELGSAMGLTRKLEFSCQAWDLFSPASHWCCKRFLLTYVIFSSVKDLDMNSHSYENPGFAPVYFNRSIFFLHDVGRWRCHCLSSASLFLRDII